MLIIPFIETPATTAYTHPQKTHSQDVRKDVRYQSVINQPVDQSAQPIIQPVDQPAPVIQTPPRQASLQPLYSQLPFNSSYPAINQPYHLYNRSPYAPTNQYAPPEPPRSPYASNQIRFTPQAPQPNLPQPIQPPAPAPQSPQPPQPQPPQPPSPAPAPQTALEPVHISQSFNEPSQSFNDSNDDFSRQLTLLNKICKENEKLSDTNSNFDFKMLKFYDKCRRARLPEHAYLQSVSIMLTSETLDYYYSNLQFCCYSFHEFCVNIKHYFEKSE